jgi:uncharacterized protein (TIGR02646 family)
VIRLPDIDLPARAAGWLVRWQAEIDGIPDFAERVSEASEKFASRNRKTNATFRIVRETLRRMCCGARRCAYCEDSAADEVEHVRPKDLYPEAVFEWSNYVYACGICNREKSCRFAVFTGVGVFGDVSRPNNAPVFPPAAGEPVLIDPRCEDPRQYLMLDLRGTFLFVELPEEGTREWRRAAYTIELLGLNARDDLSLARASAYGSYRARLREYVFERDAGASSNRLQDLVDGICRMHHPTVWAEMKRQRGMIPELEVLFAQAPEALDW